MATTMVVNGREYLLNDQLDDYVLDSIVEGILKHYPADAEIEFI